MSLFTPFAFVAAAGGVEPYPGATFMYNAYLGSSFTDISGNGNDGTVTGSPTYTEDAIGTYWSFGTGTDTNYVTTVTPTGGSSFSLQIVYYFTGDGSFGPTFVFDGPSLPADRNGSWLERNAGRLRVPIIIDNSADETFYTSWPTPTTDVWYMTTITYTSGTGQTKLWLNDTNYRTATLDTTWDASDPIYIHRRFRDQRGTALWNLYANYFAYYEGTVLDQAAIQDNMAYMEQYLDLAPAT